MRLKIDLLEKDAKTFSDKYKKLEDENGSLKYKYK
jgi:hypothetical protein